MRRRRAAVLGGAAVLLGFTCLLSLGVGSDTVPPVKVLRSLLDPGAPDSVVVGQLRLPRTLLGLAIGAALGVAGALMQALTRNPLADPGLLGINAGAAAAIVIAMALLGVAAPASLAAFGLLGAAIAMAAVHGLAARGPSGGTPVRLALAGTALTAALTGLVSALVLLNPATFDRFRYWEVGSIGTQSTAIVAQTLPFIAVGLVLAACLAPALDALALGDEAGRGLGVNLRRTQLLGGLAATLLCGAATAAAGPIVFVGLIVPHAVRALVGPGVGWVLAGSALLGPALVLGADVLGRILERPGEIEVGVLIAIVGAPAFIALVRRRRVPVL